MSAGTAHSWASEVTARPSLRATLAIRSMQIWVYMQWTEYLHARPKVTRSGLFGVVVLCDLALAELDVVEDRVTGIIEPAQDAVAAEDFGSGASHEVLDCMGEVLGHV